jgi:ABC-2 type transport system permease protein
MLKLKSLILVLLNSSFGISAIRTRAKRNNLEYLKILGIGTAIAVGFGPALLIYFRILVQGFDLLAPIGQEGAILTLGIVLVSSMIFYFGIFFVINTFYFAENIEALLFLPLKAWQVLGARFSVILVYEYLTALPFLAPPLVIYGVKSSAPFIYWIYAGLGFLLVPLAPLALALFLSVLVMRFTNFGRDMFKILSGILVIILAVATQYFFQKAGPDPTNPEFIQDLLTNPDSLINLLGQVFPTTVYLARALVHSPTLGAFLDFLTFLGVSVLALAIAWLVGSQVYFQGIAGASRVSVKRKTSRQAANSKFTQQSSRVYSPLRGKEIKLLVRTPVYFMNCVLINFLVPFFILLPFLLSSNEAMIPWTELTSDVKMQIILLTALSGIIVFLGVTNSITSTSLSREGSHFFVSKYLPIPYARQIQAKLLSGFFFGTIGLVLLLLAAALLFKVPLNLIGLIFGVSLVALLPMNAIGLLIDIFRPKLDWDNEQKAVKQNLNSIITMLVAVIPAGGISFMVIKYLDTLRDAALFMLISYGLLGILFYLLLMRIGVARYHKLEG